MLPEVMNQLEKPLQDFIARELEPRWEKLNRRDDEILREILKASAPLGLSLAIVPEELSGPGFPPQAAAYILEELAASVPAFATIMGALFGPGPDPLPSRPRPEAADSCPSDRFRRQSPAGFSRPLGGPGSPRSA